MMWYAWRESPIKAVVLRAVLSCQVRLSRGRFFCYEIASALAQHLVCLFHSYLLQVEEVHY